MTLVTWIIVLAMGLKPTVSGETFRFFFIVGSNLSKDNKNLACERKDFSPKLTAKKPIGFSR